MRDESHNFEIPGLDEVVIRLDENVKQMRIDINDLKSASASQYNSLTVAINGPNGLKHALTKIDVGMGKLETKVQFHQKILWGVATWIASTIGIFIFQLLTKGK